MKGIGPLNLSQKRETALRELVNFVVESGVYPPHLAREDKIEIAAVRNLLKYRVIRRQKHREDEQNRLYQAERESLEPLAQKIVERQLRSEKLDNSRQTQMKMEAMDVLSYLHLGSRHTWLERELKINADFVKEYLIKHGVPELAATES